MAFFDQIGDVLERYAGGTSTNVPQQQVHNDYDRIASTVPNNILGSVIGPALATLGAEQIQDRITTSASQMSAPQRGQLLQSLLSAAGSSGGNVGSLLSQLGIDRSIADNPQQASPEELGKVAATVHENHPQAFNQAMGFFSQHPTLVKVLGTVAIAKIAQQLSTRSTQNTR